MAKMFRKSSICVLEGALLRSKCIFPYLFLVAFEAGSIFRAFLILLFYPVYLVLCVFLPTRSALKPLFFVAFFGLKATDIQSVASAVLPKFYLDDLRYDTYKEFIGCDTRYVISVTTPRALIEPFLKEFLEVERILAPELHVASNGFCTGFIASSGSHLKVPAQLGICTSDDRKLIIHCKQKLVVEASENSRKVPREHYLKPLIFHDGRIAVRPTPLMALTIFLWLPVGIFLLIPRSLILVLFPHVPTIVFLEALLGVDMRCRGRREHIRGYKGNLFVCSHRTLMDPVILSGMVCKRVTAVTYSISRLSEVLSPIRTVRLTRCRSQDAETIRRHLRKGDLIVCPEGTTCRERYLLRFSKLFVEIAETVVPVAMQCNIQLFHGTSVRGWKALDPFFFGLNPSPGYEVEFLQPVDLVQMAESGMNSFEIANDIQRRIADALGYECTGFTRKDKYRILAGNDGVLRSKPRSIIKFPPNFLYLNLNS